MANNKRKNEKYYINCYSKFIKQIKFKTIEENSSPKKFKINSSLDDKQSKSITKIDEIIEINSMSSCKLSNQNDDDNCILKTSSYTSSELIDSAQSNKIQLNQRQNTIPADSFQKFLNSLEKKKLSTEDKVMSWDYSSDISDVEDVVNFEERRKLLRLLYRNNNKGNNNNNIQSNIIVESTSELPIKKLLRSSKVENNQTLPRQNDEKILKLTNPSKKLILTKSDNIKDKKHLNSVTPFVNNNNCCDHIKIPSTISGIKTPLLPASTTNKLIQIRKDYGSNKEEIFKIPNVPKKYLPSQNIYTKNDMVKNQKEEFYKYLGLGTRSSDNESCNSSLTKNSAAAVAELKRRSLRVRRLQLYQQNNAKKNIKNNDKNCNLMDNNVISLTANRQLRLHELDEFEISKQTSKETPKIQIICSVNSNTMNNKNEKLTKNDKLISNTMTNDKKVQNKIIISKRNLIQPQLSNIPNDKPNEFNSGFKMNDENEFYKHNNHSNSNNSTNESITDEDKPTIINSDSLIIVKRSYQKSPIPKILNICHNNNNNKQINNSCNNLHNCSYILTLSNNQMIEKDKIKIEFSANYKINNKLNEYNSENIKQEIDNNIVEKDTLTEIENKSITINNFISQNNITEKETDLKSDIKNIISDNIDTKLSRSSSPSECKVILEKLSNTQINNESNNNGINIENNNMNEQKKNFKINSKNNNHKIWPKSKKLKIRSTNFNHSCILRNKKIIKIIKKPTTTTTNNNKLRKERKNSEKSINLNSPAKIAKMITKTNNIKINDNLFDSLENIDNNNIKTSIINKNITKKLDNKIIKYNIKDKKIYNENLSNIITQNFLPNPLKFEKGDVLHAYYECEFLIVVQEFSISFWKYSKVIQILGEPQEWELLGECKRKLIDEEILSPFKNRICINDSNPVYIELRARQLPNDNRECNLASPYINIYYFDVWKDSVSQQSIQLDTIKCLSKFIAYTTIVKSRYFIMCWKQDTVLGTNRTGLCKYALTPDLETLASIRDFKNLRHIVYSLECCDDDKLIGFGESQITIWDHRTGDVLTNFDLGIQIGRNLGSLISSIEFEQYLFIYQIFQNDDTDDLPELKIIAITISLNTPSFRLVYSHELPLQFTTIKSSLNTNDYCIITSVTGEEIWMMPQQPQRLLFMNKDIATSSKRFYSTGSCNFIEITGDYLNVKIIHENLLNIVAT